MRWIPEQSRNDSTPRARARSLARVAQLVSRGVGVVPGFGTERLLSLGAASVLFTATRPSGELVAVKVLVDDEERRRDGRLEREVSMTVLAAASGAPRVVAAASTCDGLPAIAFELLHGRTLLEHWEARGRRFDAVTAVTFADKILVALERLHASGIVHGDVQPRHVFVTDDGELRLLDFSRSAVVGATGILPARKPDPRNDVFAVAAMLCALTLGAPRRPEVDLSLELVCPPIRDVLEIALDANPARRFASATALRAALQTALRGYLDPEAVAS